MPDINEWVLSYGTTELKFGTLESGLPLSAQVDIGDITPSSDDMRHPNSDGLVMGVDRLGGLLLTFSISSVRDQPYPGEKWTKPLDDLDRFHRVWRADSVRQVPGSYATLLNVARGRLTYGRPRKSAPTLDGIRQGNAGAVATFAANSPNFYSVAEKIAMLTSRPATAGGLKTPLIPPFSTVGNSSEISPMVNAGTLPAWPVIELRGPGSNYSVELLTGQDSMWQLVFPGSLRFDQTLRIDTRPWSRSATIDGKPANGTIFGTALEHCTIPVGSFWGRFKVKSLRGTANATLRWRDTYASL